MTEKQTSSLVTSDEKVTVLKVIVPIDKRVIKLFFKELTGTTDEKNAQIKVAEKCAAKYLSENCEGLLLPPVLYQSYVLTRHEFETFWKDEDDRAENDSFFEGAGGD